MNLFKHIKTVLAQNEKYCKDGKLFKNIIVEDALKVEPELLSLLLNDDKAIQHFFTEVGKVLVFDIVKFQKFVSNKQFLPDSYTSFKNKIGLTANGEYLTEAKEVVLSWAYKDCVLEGGQSKDDQKRKEIFWNETLAPDEIDRLFDPKALSDFKKFDAESEHNVEDISLEDNLIIKGNNLLTLHSLKKVYQGKIKLIYIDPPYNTGKDSFLYNDSFNHSSWLTFMKNRLMVAKDLLTNDGVIFISIDINEQAYLKVLCNEIFKRDNFVGEIIWETATDNNATQISMEHEYVLCYSKNKSNLPKWKIKSEKATIILDKYDILKKKHKTDTVSIEKELRGWINSVKKSNEYDLSGVSHYSYVDEKGVFYPGNSANTKQGGYTFDIIHPITKKVCNKPNFGYRWPEETFWNADKNGDVLWGKDQNTIPKIKKRIETATELLKGYFYEDNRKSTNALASLMGKKVFSNPKSINLLKKIIKFSTSDNDIVLDFFAGSGSTAQALLEVNTELSSNRKFILCEQMDYVHTVTIPRVQKILNDNHFKYFELTTKNESYINQITSAVSLNELKKITDNIFNDFISVYITEEIKGNIKESINLANIEVLKSLLIEVLDKNWLYVPFSEIKDETHLIDENSIKLSTKFYSQR
jgi:adenine-specific DNA-methyltransferase